MEKVKYDFKQKSKSRVEEKDNFVNKLINSGVGKILLLGISILMLLSVYRSIKQMGQKISLLKQAEYEVEELRIKNLELSLQIEDASNDEHLEKEARDRLNYGQENEIVFVINDELVEVGKERVQAILYPESVEENIDILNEWVEFVMDGY
jgi:cell division protein FtsB